MEVSYFGNLIPQITLQKSQITDIPQKVQSKHTYDTKYFIAFKNAHSQGNYENPKSTFYLSQLVYNYIFTSVYNTLY